MHATLDAGIREMPGSDGGKTAPGRELSGEAATRPVTPATTKAAVGEGRATRFDSGSKNLPAAILLNLSMNAADPMNVLDATDRTWAGS